MWFLNTSYLFFKIKDAVRTSVLSKRWEYLWSSIPNLDFREGLYTNRTLFMNFVERVLVHHGTSNIEQFFLKCSVLRDASRINMWISAAVRHNVQELCVIFHDGKEPFVLPRCLFTCATLRELELGFFRILKLPSSICFSSLNILTLTCVTFSDEYSTQQLFSGCPVLEDLSLTDCNWVNLKVVSISAPKLWNLEIKDMDIDRHSSSHSDGCQVMIMGISLKYFNYFGEFTSDYCLYKSASIKKACINGFCGMRPREVAEGISLSSNTEKDDVILDPVPSCFLSHLDNIEVHLFEGDEEELRVVKILLKNATVLDKFVIFHHDDHTWSSEKQWKICEQLLELPRGSESCEVVFK